MNVYCIIGDDRAKRSRSPAIFTRTMKKHGIKGAYVPFSVRPEELAQAVNAIRVLNMAGANITNPHKEAVVKYLDRLSEGANIIGAVNTIVNKAGKLKGYNTNAIGIMDALNHLNIRTEKESSLVFGTGGAAKAAVFILNWLRTESVVVTGRNHQKAKELVNRFGASFIPLNRILDHRISFGLVINATPVSTSRESESLAKIIADLPLPGCRYIINLNYGEPEDFWEEKSMELGCGFMNGLIPLACQARRTFELWTGISIPIDEFISTLKESEQ